MAKNVKGGLWEFLNIHSLAKWKKLKGGPFGDIKKICEKKSHKAEITSTKNLLKGETQTHVLLLDRPQKLLKKSEAEEVTLVWQLVEASL